MVLWVMDLAAKPAELTLSPATHLVEGENWFSPVVLRPLCTCSGSVTPTHKRYLIRRTEFQRFSIKNRMQEISVITFYSWFYVGITLG